MSAELKHECDKCGTEFKLSCYCESCLQDKENENYNSGWDAAEKQLGDNE